MSSTLETTDAGTSTGEIESVAELVIDVGGIVETSASLDESTTTTTTEAAEVTTGDAEETPFDPSANTDAGIEPRTEEPTTEATTEQAEPGNDVAEKGGQDGEEWSENDIVTTVPVDSANDFSCIRTEEEGELLRDRLDIRAYREYKRRRDESERHVGYLALGMSRAKVAAKLASDEFGEEVERLEKIVAGGWRAIKREMEAAGRSASVYQDASLQASTKAASIASVVEATAAIGVLVTSGDSIYGDSATLDANAPSEAVSDAWRDCTVAELCAHGLRSSLAQRLAELGYDTIGKLEDLRAKISTGAVDRWPKGIGEAKITEIENAVVGWLTANRDAGVFGAIPSHEGDGEPHVDGGDGDEEGGEYPSTEAWDKLPAEKKKDWLGSRCENLGTLKARESEKAFNAGRDAWHAGQNVDACDYYPGARGDDWLRGWVTGSMEPQQVKAAAVKPDDQPAKESTSVDDLFG